MRLPRQVTSNLVSRGRCRHLTSEHRIQCRARRLDDVDANGRPFLRIALEQFGLREVSRRKRQLPRQIACILQSCIHALTADRRMDMRGVAGDEHAAPGISRHDAMADTVDR